MAATGGGAPMYSGYGQPPKIRLEVIGEAWQLFIQQMNTWIMACLVVFVAMLVPMIIMGVGFMGSFAMMLGGGRAGAAVGSLGMMLVMFVGAVLVAVVSFVAMGGMYRMAIKQVRGEPIQLSDLWSVTDVLVQLVIGGLLMGLAVGVASMLCYLPGFVVGGLLLLTIPLIVDQKMTAMDALSRSWNTMKPDWLMAAVLYLILGLIVGLGASIVIGFFVAYPLFFLGTALVYRDFILGGGGAQPGGPAYPVGVTPGGNPPDLYAAQQPPPPTDLR